MAHQIVNEQSKQTRDRVRELMGKHGITDPDNANTKRERFLALLKRQYGYTNDKAVDELERLLKQFHTMNRSLSIHRPRAIFKHPRAE
jgi:hypothetical protein